MNRALIRHNDPFNLFDTLFDETFSRMLPIHQALSGHRTPRPDANIKNTAEGYNIELAVPGLSRSDINIESEGDQLYIFAESSDANTNVNASFSTQEFSYSSFNRTFSLPKGVDIDLIEARYDAGILTVRIPKMSEVPRKKITIS